MNQHEVEAKKKLKILGFLGIGLAMLFTTGRLLISFAGGEISFKSNGQSSFGSAEASVSPGQTASMTKKEVAEALTKAMVQADSAKKTLSATTKTSTKSEEVQKKDASISSDVQKTAALATPSKSSKKQGKTVLNLSHKKWLIKEKWGWFLEICCREEGLPEECVDTLISLSAHESGGHPGIKNDSSSATGLFQFITSTGKTIAEELDIDPRLYNPKDPYQNIRLGVRYFAKNRKVYNSSLWGILSHYTGTGGARDTANYYGGINNTPFVIAIKAAISAPYEEPQQWAIAKWKGY
jgi:hypothetical protein